MRSAWYDLRNAARTLAKPPWFTAAIVATRALTAVLYGVSPTDPLTFLAVALFLGAVTLLACYLPARGAAAVEPISSLRYE